MLKSNKFKQGAMFGLDARIALAIFGALSVISGAALYSAIQEAKIVALVNELSETEKAIEAYILDTGLDLPIDGAPKTKIRELKSSTVQNWKGPYLSFEDYNTNPTSHAKHQFDRMTIPLFTSLENSKLTCTDASAVGKACYYYIFWGVVPADIANALELKLDGAIDQNAGSISYNSTNNQLFYKSKVLTLKQYR